jgi:hypothetical protein
MTLPAPLVLIMERFDDSGVDQPHLDLVGDTTRAPQPPALRVPASRKAHHRAIDEFLVG